MLLLAVCVGLLAGFPVAFSLAGIALIFAAVATLGGIPVSWGAIPIRVYGIVTNQTLLAVPFFIVMGLVLEKSKVAEDLLACLGSLLSRFPGGLGVSVTLVGALLAASTGIVGATVMTMGLIALPALLSAGYTARQASGSIAAAGTLGQIIPPSIVLVILSDQISAAYQSAQTDMGIFAPEPFSVADLFSAAIIPSLVLVGFYLVYQVLVSYAQNRRGVRDVRLDMTTSNKVVPFLRSLLPPILLIVGVLGSLLGGLATPTEAAAIGAGGSLVLAGSKHSQRYCWPALAVPVCSFAALALLVSFEAFFSRMAVYNFLAIVLSICLALGLFVNLWLMLRARILFETLEASVQMTAMVFAIVIGASIFSLVFRDFGGDETIRELLNAIPGGTVGAIAAVMVVLFVLGFFLDFLEITYVAVPLVAPVLLQMEMPGGSLMAPAWLGIMIALNLQTSFLTPPFGFALFYLRGVAPDTVRTSDIYLGALPFVGLQIAVLVLLWFAPSLATWLPELLK
ncbi:TRAP transporter large permease subunit [Roseibium hamelinense]|nr:TRAP transporter large permease subunit [Roseibium hamelinense]MTI45055.1 TRAP transporter large permease subunit [Roseibium hamelinense]